MFKPRMFEDLQQELDNLRNGGEHLDLREEKVRARFSIRTNRPRSTRERNWQKKGKGAPPPMWATDIVVLLNIAANWYDLSMFHRKGWRRFENLLVAIHQHLYNGKCPVSELPKGDSRRKAWEARRAKCRVEWQRLNRFAAALKERTEKVERDTGTRLEVMTSEERIKFFFNALAAHAPKPGRMPNTVWITQWDRLLYQSRFDAMMSGKRPVDVAALLTSTPQESELHSLAHLDTLSGLQKMECFMCHMRSLVDNATAVGYDADIDDTTVGRDVILHVKID
jgi:hypothetical protein